VRRKDALCVCCAAPPALHRCASRLVRRVARDALRRLALAPGAAARGASCTPPRRSSQKLRQKNKRGSPQLSRRAARAPPTAIPAPFLLPTPFNLLHGSHQADGPVRARAARCGPRAAKPRRALLTRLPLPRAASPRVARPPASSWPPRRLASPRPPPAA
jgi:hypothetical protein